MTLLPGLSPQALTDLAEALTQGRLRPPYSAASVGRFVAAALSRDAVAALQQMEMAGLGTAQMGYLLKMLAEERRAAQPIRDRVELVWSGPEMAGSRSRDTGVVVRELFRAAKNSVLMSSYNLDLREEPARALFQPLAENLDRNERLAVRMFINVPRGKKEQGLSEAVLLRRFATRFREKQWPGRRLPEVYYDPRAAEPLRESEERACLHAKCVVVDGEQVLVTSANFTQAAHERNIEAGVLITDRLAAADLRIQFDALMQHGALLRLNLER